MFWPWWEPSDLPGQNAGDVTSRRGAYTRATLCGAARLERIRSSPQVAAQVEMRACCGAHLVVMLTFVRQLGLEPKLPHGGLGACPQDGGV